ncbi:DUF2829 domain-containing protein [Photorhabdus khanii]|uniref:DUF2829 domain-containing protein n=1 Tax=Photorhabdus khanii subsp. guanajuatensis TaxID=2100166 RepID=A0A4R4J6K4_9GAMM|nr:DUF2829 domain-containing protein [Photorhabdus khanii]TDB49254.1 hypothetical protein C5467_17930 [Photorhabdus khanii subsp. guanajuatensis]
MSEIMKPENECPFDPKQYECHCLVAPLGSFSWALIQLKLRKRVARSVWGDKGMYLAITPRVNDLTVEKDSAYAVDGVAVGTKYDYLTHIDLRNEHGNFVPWQPTQEDMMACDWEFFEDAVKPELGDNMIVFDIILGVGKWAVHSNMSSFGYRNMKEYTPIDDLFGSSNIIKNKANIEKNLEFIWTDERKSFTWKVLSDSNEESYHKVIDLLKNKELHITVDGKIYNLGKESNGGPLDFQYVVGAMYKDSSEARELGEILKQTGETKRFYCGFV